MLKKDNQVKWIEEAIKFFNLVKLALSSAPVLISLDYTQDFILFSFASEHTMAVVLMQKEKYYNLLLLSICVSLKLRKIELNTYN